MAGRSFTSQIIRRPCISTRCSPTCRPTIQAVLALPAEPGKHLALPDIIQIASVEMPDNPTRAAVLGAAPPPGTGATGWGATGPPDPRPPGAVRLPKHRDQPHQPIGPTRTDIRPPWTPASSCFRRRDGQARAGCSGRKTCRRPINGATLSLCLHLFTRISRRKPTLPIPGFLPPLPETFILYHGPYDSSTVERLLSAWTWGAGALGELYPLVLLGAKSIRSRTCIPAGPGLPGPGCPANASPGPAG